MTQSTSWGGRQRELPIPIGLPQADRDLRLRSGRGRRSIRRVGARPGIGSPASLAITMAPALDPRTGLPVVAMVGGGQLARMTHQAAVALGQSLRVLAATPDESAALVAREVVLGSHTSYEDLV